MAKSKNDLIGHEAEVITERHLCREVGPPFNRYLFRVVFLGDKYPAADFLIDVLDSDNVATGFFFLQVKGTTNASRTASRLTIDVSIERFNRLVQLPASTYLVGVDIPAGQAYLVAACQTRKSAVSSVTKAFPLSDDAVKIALYREVVEFWTANKVSRRTSRFQDV